MQNPFDIINSKLSTIEGLLVDIKHPTPEAPEPPKPLEPLADVEGASKFMHLSVATIYSKVSRREIPFMKRGNRLYFSLPELEKYIKDGKVRPYTELNQSADTYIQNS